MGPFINMNSAVVTKCEVNEFFDNRKIPVKTLVERLGRVDLDGLNSSISGHTIEIVSQI